MAELALVADVVAEVEVVAHPFENSGRGERNREPEFGLKGRSVNTHTTSSPW